MVSDGELIGMELTDLHTHLGASVSGHILWEIAHESGLRLPVKDYWEFIDGMSVGDKGEAHNTYLDRFKTTQAIQSSPHAVEMSVYHAIGETFRTYNITTIELRFNPLKRNREGLFDVDAVIMSAIIGMKRACLIYPVRAGIILETDRSFSGDKSEIIAQKAVKFKADGVVGFDMSGPSPDWFTFTEHVEAYRIARDGGIGTTVHAGEVNGPEEMWEAINLLKPDRIGHGVRCVKDKHLMEVIAEKGIILEICPTSNLKLGIIKDIEELDFVVSSLMSNGVKFCINSDGPTFLNTSVRDEILLLYENKILDGSQIAKLNELAKGYSFLK